MFGRFRRSEEVRSEDVIGFALSGGGARAASQVGALKALADVGISPHLLAGTSAGAINAAWFALHPLGLERLEAVWMGLRMQDIFPGSRVRMLANMLRHGYVHRVDALEATMRRHFGGAYFEEAAIPFAVIALRLSDGQRVVFESGEVVPAVMASSAIPGVFPPYRIGDELYVDGGLIEYLPLATLLERNVTTIWAMDCSSFSPAAGPFGSVVDRCGLIASSASVLQMTSLPATRGHKVHLLRPSLPEIDDARDFRRTADLMQAGYEHARTFLRQELGSRVG